MRSNASLPSPCKTLRQKRDPPARRSGGRLLVTVFPVGNGNTCGSLRSATSRRQCGSSVPHAAMQTGHQLRNGRCNGSCCVILPSVGSDGLRFTRVARSSIGRSGSCFYLSWSAGDNASASASGINDTSSGAISKFSILHGVSQLSERTARVPVPASSGVHQAECALHSWRIRRRVCDCNDGSVHICNLEIDVDVCPFVVEDCFLYFSLDLCSVCRSQNVSPGICLVAVAAQNCCGHDGSVAPLSMRDLIPSSLPS